MKSAVIHERADALAVDRPYEIYGLLRDAPLEACAFRDNVVGVRKRNNADLIVAYSACGGAALARLVVKTDLVAISIRSVT